MYGMFNGGFQLPWSCYLQSVVADPHLLIIQVPIIVAARVHGRPLCQYATATSNTLGCFEARAALEECLHTLSPKMCTDSMPGGAVRLLNLCSRWLWSPKSAHGVAPGGGVEAVKYKFVHVGPSIF